MYLFIIIVGNENNGSKYAITSAITRFFTGEFVYLLVHRIHSIILVEYLIRF